MPISRTRRHSVVAIAAVTLAVPPIAAFAVVGQAGLGSLVSGRAVVTAELPATADGQPDPRDWPLPDGEDDDSTAAEAAAGTAVTAAPGVLIINGRVPSVGGGTTGTSAGTGMVLSADGYALTNYHVVEGTSSVQATVADSRTTYAARVVGADPTHDVALLRLTDASGLTPVRADTDSVTIGQAVTAIGNGGGHNRLFKVSGAVQELDDQIRVAADETGPAHQLSGLIRTNAAVVPGYSGGPLFDAEGEVVGINTAASAGRVAQGFAIPIRQAVQIADLIKAGTANDTIRIGARPALGVTVSASARAGTRDWPADPSDGTEPRDDSTSADGVKVGGVAAGGAAAAAGIEAGSVITMVDSTPITDVDALQSAVTAHRVGDQVTVSWTDPDGAEHTATVKLGVASVN